MLEEISGSGNSRCTYWMENYEIIIILREEYCMMYNWMVWIWSAYCLLRVSSNYQLYLHCVTFFVDTMFYFRTCFSPPLWLNSISKTWNECKRRVYFPCQIRLHRTCYFAQLRHRDHANDGVTADQRKAIDYLKNEKRRICYYKIEETVNLYLRMRPGCLLSNKVTLSIF